MLNFFCLSHAGPETYCREHPPIKYFMCRTALALTRLDATYIYCWLKEHYNGVSCVCKQHKSVKLVIFFYCYFDGLFNVDLVRCFLLMQKLISDFRKKSHFPD